MNRIIVLFDMDGTLTEPRQPFDYKPLRDALYMLTNNNIHIGIITGSDEDYLREQMGSFLDSSPCRYKTYLMPCNGTKFYKPPEFANKGFELVHEVSMEEHLGPKKYRELIQELIYSQVDMANSGVALTGHFINCRGSTINWCPIGRNANTKEREEFKKLDAEEGLRDRVLGEMRAILELKKMNSGITIKLGGDTSFDIYPKGWDKTYGLKHFQDWDVWFVGDRCSENGNDYEIYNACGEQSYKSIGPEKTTEIINDILKRTQGGRK
jgi:phosphomannomutase